MQRSAAKQPHCRPRLSDLLAASLQSGDLREALTRVVECYLALKNDLSRVEVAVLESVVRGRLNKQMASEYGVSVRTIEQRRRRLYDAFGVDSSADLCYAAGLAANASAKSGARS